MSYLGNQPPLTVTGASANRNRIINGDGRIMQANPTPMNGSTSSTGADCWRGLVAGGTSIAATMFGGVWYGGLLRWGSVIRGTWTAGAPTHQVRLDRDSVFDLGGKTVTVSGLYYHTSGISLSIRVKLLKPSSLDNFTVTATLQTSASIPVGTGVVSPFSATFTLGSSDCENGLQIEVSTTTAPTVASSADFVVSALQLEQASIATPFEVRPFATELLMCQRFFEKSYDYSVAYGTSGVSNGIEEFGGAGTTFTALIGSVRFKVPKRNGTPLVNVFDGAGTIGKITVWTPGQTDGITPLAIDNISSNGFKVYSTTANQVRISFHWVADSRL